MEKLIQFIPGRMYNHSEEEVIQDESKGNIKGSDSGSDGI